MKWLILVLLMGAAASPAFAQHSGHGQTAAAPAATCLPEHAAMGHCTLPTAETTPPVAPAATCLPEHAAMGHCTIPTAQPAPPLAPAATCLPEHAAMGHCTLPTAQATPPVAPAATCLPEHAAMGHCTLQAPAPAPSATCLPEHAAMGHCQPMPDAASMPGHDMATMGQATPPPPVAPPPAEALSGPAHAQDLFYPPGETASSRRNLSREHGAMTANKFLADRMELTFGDGAVGYSWDVQFWQGGDIDKLWLKTEGDGTFSEAFGGGEGQALWSHAIDPWFDLQGGVRQDFGPGPDRTHLVLGFQGLAPYWFELEGAVFLSTKGEVTARFEGEYDLRLTRQIILQPRVEVDFSLQNVPQLRLGSGITSAEFGARLRYEFFPASGPAVIAPYVGLQYERAFGQTGDFRLAAGDGADGVNLLVGVRTWF